jgi:hypothetical protein
MILIDCMPKLGSSTWSSPGSKKVWDRPKEDSQQWVDAAGPIPISMVVFYIAK